MMPTDYPVRICAAGLCVWSHRFVCVCMYMWTKKRAVWGLTTRKSPVSVIYCSLVKFNGQKRGLLCQAIRSGKGIWNHSINGMEKGSGKLYYGKPRLVYMHCSYANAERQHATVAVQTRPTISLQVQSVLTVLRAHRVCSVEL